MFKSCDFVCVSRDATLPINLGSAWDVLAPRCSYCWAVTNKCRAMTSLANMMWTFNSAAVCLGNTSCTLDSVTALALFFFFLGFFAPMAPQLVGLLHFGSTSIIIFFFALTTLNLKIIAISLNLITPV